MCRKCRILTIEYDEYAEYASLVLHLQWGSEYDTPPIHSRSIGFIQKTSKCTVFPLKNSDFDGQREFIHKRTGNEVLEHRKVYCEQEHLVFCWVAIIVEDSCTPPPH